MLSFSGWCYDQTAVPPVVCAGPWYAFQSAAPTPSARLSRKTEAVFTETAKDAIDGINHHLTGAIIVTELFIDHVR